MTEDEMVEAAIRAGEEAADNDFKLKFEQAQKELADVRNELDAAARLRRPPRTRQRTPPSAPPVYRPTGRTSRRRTA